MYEEVEGEDSETARQEFKMSTLTEMLDGCGKIGVPLSPLKIKRFGKRNGTDFACWPIVKAIGEWAIKRSRESDPALAAANAARPIKISKGLLNPVNVSSRLTEIGDDLDPMQLHACLTNNVNQLQRQVENICNVLDLKVKRSHK